MVSYNDDVFSVSTAAILKAYTYNTFTTLGLVVRVQTRSTCITPNACYRHFVTYIRVLDTHCRKQHADTTKFKRAAP